MARMKVTFSDAEQAAIDSLRGQLPAATWVRNLVRDAGIAARVLDEAQGSVGGRGVNVSGTAAEPAGSSPVPEPRRASVPAIAGVVRGSEVDQPGPMLGGLAPSRMVKQPRPIVQKRER